MPTVNLTDARGWHRLGVIHAIRDARDAGLVRHDAGRVLVHHDCPPEVRAAIAADRALAVHALTYDRAAPRPTNETRPL